YLSASLSFSRSSAAVSSANASRQRRLFAVCRSARTWGTSRTEVPMMIPARQQGCRTNWPCLDAQRAPVGEEGWRTAGVEKNDIPARLPPPCPHERDQASEPFAGVDRIEPEAFERTRQLHRLNRRIVRDTVSWSGVAGDDLDVRLIERCIKQMGSGLRISDNVCSHPLWFSVDVNPNHARAFKRD